MKQLLIRIIGFFQNDVTRLSNSSAGIVDVFTKTINDLKSVNTDIEIKMEAREQQMRRIAEEKDSLSVLKSANERVISKLNTVFE